MMTATMLMIIIINLFFFFLLCKRKKEFFVSVHYDNNNYSAEYLSTIHTVVHIGLKIIFHTIRIQARLELKKYIYAFCMYVCDFDNFIDTYFPTTKLRISIKKKKHVNL